MLEALSELFYNPWMFWGVPLLIALVLELIQYLRTQYRRRFGSHPHQHS